MRIIQGTVEDPFQNLSHLQSLLHKSIKKALRIIKDLSLVTDIDFLTEHNEVFKDKDGTKYIRLTEEIFIYEVVNGYRPFVSNGSDRPILWLDLLPKDTSDVAKISRNLKNCLENMPTNVWVHEAYHMIAGKDGDELVDDPTVDELCENEEEIIATYMEILYLLQQGYLYEEISQIVAVFDEDINEMDKFFELTTKYRK